jgi:hypothetical protein
VAVPTTGGALGLGWRAATESAWLAPVGMLVAVSRGALVLPAMAFAWALLAKGALAGLLRDGLGPGPALLGALEAARTPRFLATFTGLWAAGALLAAALRVAYLAGALPTLGGALAGARQPPPAFAAGVAFGLPRLAGTAVLAFALDLVGAGLAATAVLGAALVSLHARALATPVLAAAVVAAALTAAVTLPFALSAVGDAALARTALRGDAPARALTLAAGRFLARPGAFLLATLAVGLFGLALSGSLQSLASLATGFAQGSSAWLLAGPQLVVALASALIAAWVDLWRLAALAALACHE